uniref:Uncharacterized protein n=1 Tax=Meloidogyne javanica TaxID=6303 RepID=A0A915LWX6_MELJA
MSNNTTATTSTDQQKYLSVLNELNSFPCSQSYWARKSRMLTLESEFGPLEFNLLEFDIALKFRNAKDLSFNAQKIYQLDKSEKVRQRIGQLFSVLLDGDSDKLFSSELVGELNMDILQEMFFFAFPEQRNSTKGSLQVYLTFACNQPNKGREEGITAMDAVLFRLFDSLIQSKFGDLSLHNITQIYQIILKNCFADSIGRIPDDFYSNEKIGENLEKILIKDDATQLLENSEFVKFVIYWIIASPLKDVQKDFSNQFVYVPANIFWVDSSGFEHFWLYNLDVEEDDSPAEIEEIKQEKEGLKLFDLTKELPLQNLFMKILYLQILIVERKLKLAFELGIELIKEINLKEVTNDGDELVKFPALVISQEPVWVQLENQKHTFLYIQLLLFHICWLSFTKFQRSLSAEMNETTNSFVSPFCPPPPPLHKASTSAELLCASVCAGKLLKKGAEKREKAAKLFG